MKRIFAILLASSLAISGFCACGSDTENTLSESSAAESVVADVNAEDIVGVWTGRDSASVATYVFNENGKGNLVTYQDNRKISMDVSWSVKGSTLKVTLSTDGNVAAKLDYACQVTDSALNLTYNGVTISYKKGIYELSGDDRTDFERDDRLVGTWKSDDAKADIEFTLNSDGSGKIHMDNYNMLVDADIIWYVEKEVLYFSIRNTGVELDRQDYTYELDGDKLTMVQSGIYTAYFERTRGGKEESDADTLSDYPKNGGDDNLAGNWHGDGYVIEIEADGTGRYIFEGGSFEAFWGIKEGELYYTVLKEDKAETSVYSYIADGGKLYLTDGDGKETVLTATAIEESAE